MRSKWRRAGAHRRRAGGERGQRIERQVHLGRGASEPIAAHGVGEVFRQVCRVEQPEKRHVRIDAGDDDGGGELVAVVEHHAVGHIAADANAAHGRIEANVGARFACRSGNRVGDSARSTRASPQDRNTPLISPM